jgi:hypothetical protein
MLDPFAYAKWEAYSNAGTVSKDEAKGKYCAYVSEIAPGWTSSNSAAVGAVAEPKGPITGFRTTSTLAAADDPEE